MPVPSVATDSMHVCSEDQLISCTCYHWSSIKYLSLYDDYLLYVTSWTLDVTCTHALNLCFFP
jgi:hypothetical protein